jgi:hypothetical protein
MLMACLQSTGGSWNPRADDLAETLVYELLKSGLTSEQALQELKVTGISGKGAIALIKIAAKRVAGDPINETTANNAGQNQAGASSPQGQKPLEGGSLRESDKARSGGRAETEKRRFAGLVGLILLAVVVYLVWTYLGGGEGWTRNVARNGLLAALAPFVIYCLGLLFGNSKKEDKP